MPSKLVKSYAKQTKKSSEAIERTWKATEKQVSKQYPKVKKGSAKYYSLVNAIVRKKLKMESIEEESQASTTTTSANIGAGMGGAYAKRMLAPSKAEVKSDDIHNKKVLKSFKAYKG